MSTPFLRNSALTIAVLCYTAANCSAATEISGELRQWHCVIITFDGPVSSEAADLNPFTNYRLDVTFIRQGTEESIVVPGFYAADGEAGQTGADVGDKWRVNFAPPEAGEWKFTAHFYTGEGIAIAGDASQGTPVAFHEETGSFAVKEIDKTSRDLRTQGTLQYVDGPYLMFAGTKQAYLKAGADSPENFLAYEDFEGTYRHSTKVRQGESKTPGKQLHKYEPHLTDWQDGDPTWGAGRGKGIIGAINYLASKQMNSVYFLTTNVNGDGKDVWPWAAHDVRDRFDCSKLDQWEIVFTHMDRLGLAMHVITQETENDQLLDGGDLGPERKLYYRELIARFGHHPALIWNLGEENTNSTTQQKAFCDYIKHVDPYDHPIVVHTYPNQHEKVYGALLGYENLDGLSVQTDADVSVIHGLTSDWIKRSTDKGHSWFVCIDEPGSAGEGVSPDQSDQNNHRQMIHEALWGNLLAGGSGVEWYFGYRFAHNDLNCEDWRSRDRLWDATRHAISFFHEYLPFTEMQPVTDLNPGMKAYCLAQPGEVYAMFIPASETVLVRLEPGEYTLHWYDPTNGGDLQTVAVKELNGTGSPMRLADPPQTNTDWVALIRRK